MRTAILRPAEGRRVLNHQRDFLPLAPEGEQIEIDAAFLRALAEGDVVEITSAALEPDKPQGRRKSEPAA